MNNSSQLPLSQKDSQETLLIVPYLHVLNSEIKVVGGTFRTATTGKFQEQYGELNFRIRPVELMEYFGYRFDRMKYEEFPWTALELDNTLVPIKCYRALIDLVTNRWIYEIDWQGKKKSRRISLTSKFIQLFNSGSSLLIKERKFRVALLRWSECYLRSDPLDTVLDCCSCLEASFQMGDELRLRTALAVYHTLKTNRKEGFRNVYEMYGVRNNFIHGANIPNISKDTRRKYVMLTADILMTFLKDAKMPDSLVLSKKIVEQFGGQEN